MSDIEYPEGEFSPIDENDEENEEEEDEEEDEGNEYSNGDEDEEEEEGGEEEYERITTGLTKKERDKSIQIDPAEMLKRMNLLLFQGPVIPLAPSLQSPLSSTTAPKSSLEPSRPILKISNKPLSIQQPLLSLQSESLSNLSPNPLQPSKSPQILSSQPNNLLLPNQMGGSLFKSPTQPSIVTEIVQERVIPGTMSNNPMILMPGEKINITTPSIVVNPQQATVVLPNKTETPIVVDISGKQIQPIENKLGQIQELTTDQAVKTIRQNFPMPEISNVPKTLDELLIRGKDETPEVFDFRVRYARFAVSLPSNKIDPPTAVLLSEIAVKRALLGVKYPQELEGAIDFVNKQIVK